MKDTITKYYPNLTGQERFQLAIKATAAGNESETNRLIKTCPKKDYRMNDAAFLDRMEAAETLTFAFALDFTELHGRLQMVEVFEKLIPSIVEDIKYQAYLNMVNCYEEGEKQGWLAAGGKGKLPATYKYSPEKVMKEISPEEERHYQLLIKIREAFQGQLKALWKAFSEVCREEMGLEPDTPLAAFYCPVLAYVKDDLVEDIAIDEDMKDKSLELMRDYWQKRIGIL